MRLRALTILQPVGTGAGQLLDRLLCVGGAVLFSQAPEFMQQYLQRLEGRLDEARRQVAALTEAARQSGLSLDQLVANALHNPDPAIVRLGGVAQDTTARVAQLQSADEALRHASLFSRPFVFARHFDPATAHGTWEIFRPAVPTTAEGLVYAGVGVLVALALFHGAIRYPLYRWRRHRAERRAEPAVIVT